MKQVLITGAYGFLGRNTAKLFSDNGCQVTGIGHGKWADYEYKQWGLVKWLNSTITFESLINLGESFDVIVHCGGSGSVSYSYENPYEDFQKTVQSTLAVLEYIRLKCSNCHFIYASSPAIQGDVGKRKIKENDPSNPVSPYGFHKKAAEELCFSYARSFGVKVSIIRFFSIYGPGLQKQLLWDACLKIKNADGEVEFFGTGNETRDWIYITDAIALILLLANNNKGHDLEIINCGSGTETSVYSTIQSLITLGEKKVELKFNQKVKPGDPLYYQADISKATKLGWKPEVDLRIGLSNYLQYFKKLMND